MEYREADDGAKVFALTHDGIQIQLLQASTLELAAPFVSLEQELIEFAYDYDQELISLAKGAVIGMV